VLAKGELESVQGTGIQVPEPLGGTTVHMFDIAKFSLSLKPAGNLRQYQAHILWLVNTIRYGHLA
jgi:hypothetical protein